MLFKSRQEILADFRAQIAQGKILVGVGAGTGITAKCSEKAGVDMLIIYNSGRFRMAGRGSLSGLLAYGDANKIVVEMGYEVLPVVKKTPVLAGVCGTDPFRVMDIYLKELKAQGFQLVTMEEMYAAKGIPFVGGQVYYSADIIKTDFGS